MNWHDCETAWKRQELPGGAEAVLSTLRDTFEAKRRKLAAMLLIRDWIEISACAVTVVSYVSFWRQVGPSGWPMALAILLILAVAAIFLRERLRTRRNRVGTAAPLLAKIEADLAELQHQRRLLLRVWVWYIAPCAAAVLIHVSVIIAQARPGSSVREPFSLGAIVVFLALLCWFVWTINRCAVRKRIEPRLAELEKLHHDILAPGTEQIHPCSH